MMSSRRLHFDAFIEENFQPYAMAVPLPGPVVVEAQAAEPVV